MLNKIIKLIGSKKNFIFFSLLKLSTQLLTLVSSVFIIRKLPVEDFGSYSLILTVVGFASTFGFSWTSSSLIYFGSKELEENGNLNKTFWSRNILVGISLFILTTGFLIFQDEINSYIGASYLFMILIWIYLRVYQDYMSYYFLAVKKQNLASSMLFFVRVIFLVVVIFVDFDLKKLIVFSILSEVISLLYLFGLNKKDISKFEFDKKHFKEILNFSLWQLFGFSGVYIINFGDNLVIKYFLSTEAVGIYNASYKIYTGISLLSYVISSYYAANLAVNFLKKQKEKINSFFYKERFFILLLSLVLHLIIIISSKQIISFLYGDEYESAVSVLQILMIGSFFRYIEVFYVIFYNTNKKYRFLQITNIIQSVINIVLSISLVSLVGILGAAIATTIAMILKTLLSILYCERKIYSLSKEIKS